ncbi:hypothetical protein [Nocardioides sp. CFH 31398]|uniref:hypothetical protein n=1 Tax=Nocardioides sp. CFH 31398 TaxID=2919579 RepID=UPI001F0509BB|nr:hypothetical protein [Nocardioides sp. CFH 31398]MCH1865400.1 hypothetical protein [Nocardioides sp. CFH 31398]
MEPSTADRLAEATEAAALSARLQRQLDEARERVLVSAQAVEEATSWAAEKERDVERLRGFGWSGVLASVTGSKDDDLHRGEAEALAARTAAAQAEQQHAQDAAAVTSLRERIRDLGSTTTALAEARDAHEAWLIEHDPERGPRLRELAASDGALAAEQREVREALAAGREAQDRLVAALDLLRSADDWATWDLLGGGVVSGGMKHERLRQVGDQLEQAGLALRRFDAELADVHRDAAGAVAVSAGQRFVDVWFDTLASDLAASRRIDDAVQRTRAALERVRDAGQRLEAREREVTARRTVVADERVHQLDR